MKYKVSNLVIKQSSKGNTYYEADFTDETGVMTHASTFDVLTENASYDGEIVTNGSFTNFKLKIENKGSFGASRGGSAVKAAQERKEGMISQFQDRKENGMTLAATARDATLLTVAMMGQPNMITTEEEVKEQWKMWRSWLLENHGDPKDITSTKQPF